MITAVPAGRNPPNRTAAAPPPPPGRAPWAAPGSARGLVAAHSGHYIQLQQPELVTASSREVVAAARRAPPAAVRGLPRAGGGPGGGPGSR